MIIEDYDLLYKIDKIYIKYLSLISYFRIINI